MKQLMGRNSKRINDDIRSVIINFLPINVIYPKVQNRNDMKRYC